MKETPETDSTMRITQGEFQLQRNPPDPRLQAWDAADEFIFKQLDELKTLKPGIRILVLNDSFGALALGLTQYDTYWWNDSFLSHQAMRSNLQQNQIEANLLRVNSAVDIEGGSFDLILIKIPKALALLEHQLHQIRNLAAADCKIIAAGMARNIHNSTLELFETIIGPARSSRAWKKSRIIEADLDRARPVTQSRFPEVYQLEVDREYQIANHANLFSRDRLDIGSRFLLENMPVDEKYHQIVDLGCGNGVLGIVAAALNPGAELSFFDESMMAVASAQDNFSAAFGNARVAEFGVGDCLQGLSSDSQDLVVNNPPFHQQQVTGDQIAWNMFKDARRVLRKGGELWVVGNHHLSYSAKLKKLFGSCKTVAGNKKFVILKATRQ